MIKLKIDNQNIEAPEGTTILDAAKSAGIEIPNMCYMKGYTNSPSCMICVVKDNKTGKLIPSCALSIQNGMDITTSDDEIKASRKDSLELLFSDHVGDCEAPCRVGCPAFMDIPEMNRLIAKGDFTKALEVVKEHIALPFILGYICSAPCEKMCHRKEIDNPVAICQLKKFTAKSDDKSDADFFPEKESAKNKKVAIIGSGVAGLTTSFHLLQKGYECTIFDSNNKPGGELKDLAEDTLPQYILDIEIELLKKYGLNFEINQKVTEEYLNNVILSNYDAVVVATGEIKPDKSNTLGLSSSDKGLDTNNKTFTTDNPKIFACGSIVKKQKMAIRIVAQGKITAESVNDYLSGKTPEYTDKMFNSRFGKINNTEYDEYLTESVKDDITAISEGKLDGYSEEEAMKEAARCMHCDCRKASNCKLRDYADEYNIDQNHYKYGERNSVTKYYQHDFVVYEPEKCIKCGLCVDISEKDNEITGLTFIGRGFDVKVDIPFNKELKEALTKSAQKCIDNCPTGALANK